MHELMSIKPYYEQDGITIYHGDCQDVLPYVQADVVITDPPYGIAHPTDYRSRGRDGKANCTDYPAVRNDDKPFDPSSILKLQLPALLWGANWYADRLPPSGGWLVWDKERPDDLDQATCELAWTNFIKGVRRFRYLWNGMIRAGNENLCHPTQKPVALTLWVLSLKWTPAGVVLDPYMGAGGVLVASKRLGRKAIGIEIEEKYCEIAAQRLAQREMF